ncbi:MAG: tyrosine-protein phosphatase [Bacteroidales bacterium]|nr:tyrosine-protein phosphatase [Bacteroidales bacterium]
MIQRFLSLLFIVPMMAFCSTPPQDNQENNNDPDPKDETKPVIVYEGEHEITVESAAGSGTLTFTCNTDWTAAGSKSWLTVSPESGVASDTPVTLTYNYTQTDKKKKRIADINITGDRVGLSVTITQTGDPMAGAAEELKSGDEVLATNPLVEKFLTEVTYKDWPEEDNASRKTQVFNYYGGFDGVNLTWDNWGKEWPDGDIPCQYSIRWKEEDLESGVMTLHMEDELGWEGVQEIEAGSIYVNIKNLVPNDHYTYSVTAASGKVLAEGNFTTTGHLHQVYFEGDPQKPNVKGGGGRNARDFGGWQTLDGKTVKYRKVYHGGRLNEKWTPYPLNATGEKEVLFEGLGAELDLRGNSDVIFEPAVAGLDHCAPVIEEGGKTMLTSDAAKTKECFEFVVNSVRNNKPVYFHCSLGRDRTGTLFILLMGLLGVREGDIAKEYELTYFAPVGYSVSSSDKKSNPIPTFRNTRLAWVYSDVTPYFWELAQNTPGKTFAEGVEKYLLEVAGVSQQDIDDFRSLMLE